ncbi:MAG: hypothetical protein D6717_10475 [Gammaproteobacteria bacterium]|nr:MAG: hypothetical protein D6717_10475 [Gammaproteobacteria bacterium]
MGALLGTVAGLVALQTDGVRAQTPVPAFERMGKPARVEPAASGNDGETTTIDIRHVRVVRGRIMLVGFDNKERPLPDGVYRTADGKRVGVAGGRIRYITLPAALAAPGKPVASGGETAKGRGGLLGSHDSGRSAGKAPGRRGRYRVTINGFTVHHETKDDMLQRDGKRDEIYVTAQVAVVEKNKRIRRSMVVETKVLGDTNGHSGRVRAGTASRRGGIRTGDDIPGPQPWRLRGAPRGDRLPLAVWEGELVQGENTVVVIPVLWEYDGNRSWYRGWLDWGKRIPEALKAESLLSRLSTAQGRLLFDLDELNIGKRAFMSFPERILGQNADRPIGTRKFLQSRRNVMLSFSPKALVLTYDTAESALKDNLGGKGPGLISIRYKDHPDLEGDYTMYVQVRRL